MSARARYGYGVLTAQGNRSWLEVLLPGAPHLWTVAHHQTTVCGEFTCVCVCACVECVCACACASAHTGCMCTCVSPILVFVSGVHVCVCVGVCERVHGVAW